MAYPAIETRFIGATAHKSARIKATSLSSRPSTGKRESVTIPFSYSRSAAGFTVHHDGDHLAAAVKLAQKLGISSDNISRFASGATDRGYVFVVI